MAPVWQGGDQKILLLGSLHVVGAPQVAAQLGAGHPARY